MENSIKFNKFNLPPILPINKNIKLSSNCHPNNKQTTFQFNVNKNLFKLNELVVVLNKCKLVHFDDSYNYFLTISQLLNSLTAFEKHEKLDLINWNMFRGLIGLFVDIIKSYSDNYKILTLNPQLFDNISNIYSKKTFQQLNHEIRHVITCSNILKILYIFVINSKELKSKLEDFNGLDVLIKVINDDYFIKSNHKHVSVESSLLMIYNLSIDNKRKTPIEYGDILLKFNKLDDMTAFVRCKSVLNLFPNNESFEERIGTKVSLFLKLLKKSYASPIKAEINSIFFIYSALKEVKYKSKIVKLILDENCLQIFLIKLSELSFVCNKFIYPQNNHNLDQKLLPYFDSNQNMNNSYRTIYYSYVFYQLLYLNGDFYKRLPPKAKYYATKSLSTFLSNNEFLKNFSIKCPSTVIDLEKCLLCVNTLNEITNNHFDINVFDILFNIGIDHETCAKESFLILSKIRNPNKLNKTLEKFFLFLNEETSQISNIFSSRKIYSCLFLLYILLEEKLNKTNDFNLNDEFDKAILNDKYQKLVKELINYSLENFNFRNDINLDKYVYNINSSKESRPTEIIYYLIYLNWFVLNNKCLSPKKENYFHLDLNTMFDTFVDILSNNSFFNENFQYKITQSILNLINRNSNSKQLLNIDSNKLTIFNNILYKIISDPSNLIISLNYGPSRSAAPSASSRSFREPIIKSFIIDDLISIIIKLIEYDTPNHLGLYLKFIETHLIDLKFKSFKPENLIKIYHYKEREYFNAYSKYRQTSTYNLLILSQYFRNNGFLNLEKSFKLVQNLKQLFLNDDIYLIEKTYIIDLIISLIINDHIQIDTIRNDPIIIEKLKIYLSVTSSHAANINLIDEINARNKEQFKLSIRKLLSQTCNELIWLISDDFHLDLNDKQVFTKLLTQDKNVLIMYSLDCINDCFKIRDELEKHDYKINIDTYDNIYDFSDMNTIEKHNIDKIKKLIQDNAIIIICLTDKYKKSRYGTLKAKYAHIKQKTIVPVIMKKKIELNDWLKNLNKDENRTNLIDMNDCEDYNDFIEKLLFKIKNSRNSNLTIRRHSTSTVMQSLNNQGVFLNNESISSLTSSNINLNNNTIELSLKNDDSPEVELF